jgi:hypothetical protein
MRSSIEMQIMKADTTYIRLASRIHRYRQKKKTVGLAEGFVWWAIVTLIAAVIVIFAEAHFHMPRLPRTGLAVLFLAAAIGFGVFKVLRPAIDLIFRTGNPDDDCLAMEIGNGLPDVRDRLIDGMQVVREMETGRSQTSESLTREAISRVERQTEGENFCRLISWKTVLRHVIVLIGVIAVTGVIWFFIPNTMSQALDRMVHADRVYPRKAPFSLDLEPGNIRVVHGQEVSIRLLASGAAPQRVQLFLREDGEEVWREKVLESPFQYRIPAIRRDTEYYASSGSVKSPRYRIQVVHLPFVRGLSVKLVPPGYSGLEIRHLEPNTGYIYALKGTRVEISIRANKRLSKATLDFENGSDRRMDVRRESASGSFSVWETDSYLIRLEDTLGLKNADPIPFSIDVQEDLPPVARIVHPEPSVDLDETMALPLTLEGEDDFGLSEARLVYRIIRKGEADSSEAPYEKMPFSLEGQQPRRFLQTATWDMTDMDLFPEDIVTYALELWDNDRIGGPKMHRSPFYRARFPSMYEIYQEVEKAQDRQVMELADVLQESREMKEILERLDQEIKSGKNLEWEEKEKLNKMSGQQQELENRIKEMEDDLENMIQQLDRHNLIGPELLEKYQELQRLYREMDSPELREAMKKLQEAAAQISQEAMNKALKDFQLSQETFLKSVERTLMLLKRMQVEQKAEELVRKMSDLAERQQSLNRELREQPADLDSLAKEEDAVQEDMEGVRQDMNGLRDKMEELPGMPLEQLEAAMEMADENRVLEQLDQAAAAMRDGDLQRAGMQGESAGKTMESMSEMLMSMQQALKSGQKEKVMSALRRAARKMLDLSQAQEQLTQDTRSGKKSGSGAARDQMGLMSGLSQVADSLTRLGRETFLITPEMGRALGEAMTRMQQAIRFMGRNGGEVQAEGSQRQAMGALNRGVMAIQDAMNQLSGASSGLGSEQFMLQLNRMAQEQMGLNQQTRDLMHEGRLSLEEQAAMSRLAARQQAIREALQEWIREYGGRREVLGRLDRMVEEMEAVVQELREKSAGPETLRRQERILSRLLDASNSLHRRDYSRERQARPGQEIRGESPPGLLSPASGWEARLRQDILRMAREGYTRDYQNLIRLYFEALMDIKRISGSDRRNDGTGDPKR